MRKAVAIALTVMIAIGAVGILSAQAQQWQDSGEPVCVFVNGTLLDCTVAPVISKGEVIVSLKDLAQAMGVKISFDRQAREIRAEKGDTVLIMPLEGELALVNGQPVQMKSGPVLLSCILAVPAVWFSEVFNYQVGWDISQRRLDIDSPAVTMDVAVFFIPGDELTGKWSELKHAPWIYGGAESDGLVQSLELGWYSMSGDGKLLNKSGTGWWRPQGWEQVLEKLRGYGLKSQMVIYMSNHDGKVDRLLEDKAAVKKAVAAIVEESILYDGVNLDFEGLGAEQETTELEKTRTAFNLFSRQLADQLHEEGRALTLTLHPLNSIFQGYDYEALGAAADTIVIMAYDYGVQPEPLSLVNQALDLAARLVPGEKLLLGISIPSETPDSLKGKLSLAEHHNLRGIAIWYWGALNEPEWDVLRSRITCGEK